jgi:hypothetical protein
MARTALVVTASPGAYPITVGWLEFTPGDSANGNYVTLSGRYVLYVKNTDTVNQTFLIKTVADPQGRLDDQTITVPPESIARVDGITNTGFCQSNPGQPDDKSFWIDVSSSDVHLAVWKLDR